MPHINKRPSPGISYYLQCIVSVYIFTRPRAVYCQCVGNSESNVSQETSSSVYLAPWNLYIIFHTTVVTMDNCLSAEVSFSLMKLRHALEDSLTSRYLFACAVYVAYSIGMILAGSPQLDTTTRNRYYFIFGVVHLINSLMFIWTWEGKSLTDKVMIPEYLNVAGALMYLWSRCVISLQLLS